MVNVNSSYESRELLSLDMFMSITHTLEIHFSFEHEF
jgi:hypothetical protein